MPSVKLARQKALPVIARLAQYATVCHRLPTAPLPHGITCDRHVVLQGASFQVLGALRHITHRATARPTSVARLAGAVLFRSKLARCSCKTVTVGGPQLSLDYCISSSTALKCKEGQTASSGGEEARLGRWEFVGEDKRDEMLLAACMHQQRGGGKLCCQPAGQDKQEGTCHETRLPASAWFQAPSSHELSSILILRTSAHRCHGAFSSFNLRSTWRRSPEKLLRASANIRVANSAIDTNYKH